MKHSDSMEFLPDTSDRWILHNVRVEPKMDIMDIEIHDGRIAAIGENLRLSGGRICDAAGLLASPLLIDPHHHLDCAFLIDPPNELGTLEEAIEINARIKKERPASDVIEKACKALNLALQNGTGWIRNHGDINSVSKLKLLPPILEVKERYRGLVDLQIVAFPQLGLISDPGCADLMEEAMRIGANVVGGMPHAEKSADDAWKHIEILFSIAQKFDADIDMHVDESDDPRSRTLELVADATIRHRYQGRVTASHCCALAAYPDDYAKRVIEKVALAEMNVITNPMVNLYLQGRHDKQPVRRGITRVKELINAGVNVICGSDDIGNLFFPFGRMDMLEIAMMTSLTAHLTRPDEIRAAFDMPRHLSARALRIPEYDFKVGNPANIVLLEAGSALEGLRRQPVKRIVIRDGKIVSWRDQTHLTSVTL